MEMDTKGTIAVGKLQKKAPKNVRKQGSSENRLMWLILAGIAGIVVLAAGITWLISSLTSGDSPWNDSNSSSDAPQMEELDFSEKELSAFEETDQTTEYVKLTVSYTNDVGEAYTGEIVICLYAAVAPITVKNFQTLVGNGFYDGKIFHRVIKNFMIQGGGYDQNGKQDTSASAIKGEFSSNGVENHLKHLRGVVSMARTTVKDSASSQFFIMHQTSAHLDGEYAAFGFVVYGMETVDAIAELKTNSNDQPVETVVIESARFVQLK